MKVTFHATFREVAGVAEVEMDAGSIQELLLGLRDRFGQRLYDMIVRVDSLREDVVILVNGRNVTATEGLSARLSERDEVAIFPPISGG